MDPNQTDPNQGGQPMGTPVADPNAVPPVAEETPAVPEIPAEPTAPAEPTVTPQPGQGGDPNQGGSAPAV